MDFLLDNNVQLMTPYALQQFNRDVTECENFAASEPVPGFNDGTLQMAFADLRQVMDLFIKEEWSTYLNDYNKPSAKYSRVQPHVAISIMEKLSNSEKKKTKVFVSLKKNEREKKKLQETVLKQLKGLVNGQTQAAGHS